MSPHGIMFHHFWDERHPNGQGALSTSDFVDIINYLGTDNILPAHVWAQRALEGTLQENDLCFTFDDALLCQYDIAFPVLKEMGISAFWFIYSAVFQGKIEPLEIYRYFRTTEFDTLEEFYDTFKAGVAEAVPDEYSKAINTFRPETYLSSFPFYTDSDRLFRYLRDDVLGSERYHEVMRRVMTDHGFDLEALPQLLWMNNGHLRELSQSGQVVGLHSNTHPTRLAGLDLKAQEDEYTQNVNHIKSVVGDAPMAVAHPCNSYSVDTIEILKRLGISLGFRSTMQPPSTAYSPVFECPREDHANILKAIRNS